jgi:glycosyltransferase involved in cell wall biosynthesis
VDICIIAPPWLPVPAPAYGGTEAVLDQLARGLRRAGHEVLLVAHPDSTCTVDRASVIAADDAEPMGRGVVELEHVIGAYELARDADVVHDHTMAGPVYARHVQGLPVVTTSHGPFNRTTSAVYRAVVPRVGLVAISESQAATTDLPLAGVVHHGVDVDEFPAGDGAGGYAVFLGRMAPEKGAHRAIEAARRAGVPLYLAAKMREPDEIAYFDAHVRPRLGPDVEYLGEIDSEAKLRLLAGARALLNPITWSEPFGMVMLESLACGTPVLGFPGGAAPEIVEHGRSGFLVDSVPDLVAALGRVDALDRADCRDRARWFSVERMVNGYLRVFYRARRGAGLSLRDLADVSRPARSAQLAPVDPPISPRAASARRS